MQGLTRQGQPKRNLMFPDSNVRRSHRINRILHHPTFLFSWLKTQFERREYHEDEISTVLSIEMIETVFVDRMNGFQCLIDGNGDYVS
jgi:hypothetical protein